MGTTDGVSDLRRTLIARCGIEHASSCLVAQRRQLFLKYFARGRKSAAKLYEFIARSAFEQ